MNAANYWRSPKPRFVAHPGALIDPDHYAMEMIEGRKTRNDVKREAFAQMYSGGLQSFQKAWVNAVTVNLPKGKRKRIS